MGTPIIQTPNLDRMAGEGVLFSNNFCTTPICMASRASVFTGQYVRTHGIDNFAKPLSPEAYAMIYPELLRQSGYRTGFIGKWGLGGELPADKFDFFQGFPGQGHYFNEINGKKEHLRKTTGDHIEAFLKAGDGSKPFCLSVSFKEPHVEDGDPRQYLYDPELEDLYKDDVIPPPAVSSDAHFNSLPDFVRTSEGRTRWGYRFETPEHYQESVKGYYRLVTGMDFVVGRARSLLHQLGLAENTIVIFTADNGIFNGEWGLAGKWLGYEQSIRTPLIVFDPRVAPGQRGRRVSQMALNIDMAPTMLDYAGVAIPQAMQGRSVRPIVEGASPAWRTEWFFEHLYGHNGKIPRSEGVRTDSAKYVRYVDPDPNLEYAWDLTTDPLEERNLFDAPDTKSQAEQLRTRWQIWHDALAAWKPQEGPWTDPA
ncbi:MAG: arylsulfatase A family protein [Candidatus Hydrogenedentota bacterium]